jgi:CheY-like chemotaxis protein
MYVITTAGRHAWESQDASMSEQYRRFLWLIDVQGGARAVRGLVRDHAPSLLSDWLKDLEQLGLIDSKAGGSADVTMPLSLNQPNMHAGAQVAASLGGTGACVGLRPKPKAGGQRTTLARKTVLVVEDEPDVLAFTDVRLTLAGCRLRMAASVEALMTSLVREGPPSLLFLDVVLPDGNGLEVLGKIRRHPEFSALPIIMLTAQCDPSDIGKGLALGADGYVVKPYSQNLITSVILSTLSD